MIFLLRHKVAIPFSVAPLVFLRRRQVGTKFSRPTCSKIGKPLPRKPRLVSKGGLSAEGALIENGRNLLQLEQVGITAVEPEDFRVAISEGDRVADFMP